MIMEIRVYLYQSTIETVWLSFLKFILTQVGSASLELVIGTCYCVIVEIYVIKCH